MFFNPGFKTFLKSTYIFLISDELGQFIPIASPSEFEGIFKKGEFGTFNNYMPIPIIIA